MQLFAPISTLFSMTTLPTCGILICPSAVGANPKPLWPILTPVYSITLSPISAHSIVTLEWTLVQGPIFTPLPI